MKKLIILSFLLMAFLPKSHAIYYYICKNQINGGVGGYGNVTRLVDEHRDLKGVLLGVDVTIRCWDPGLNACPNQIKIPGAGMPQDATEISELMSIPVAFRDILITKFNEAQLQLNSGIMQGLISNQVWMQNEQGGLTKYILKVEWSYTPNGNGFIKASIQDLPL